MERSANCEESCTHPTCRELYCPTLLTSPPAPADAVLLKQQLRADDGPDPSPEWGRAAARSHPAASPTVRGLSAAPQTGALGGLADTATSHCCHLPAGEGKAAQAAAPPTLQQLHAHAVQLCVDDRSHQSRPVSYCVPAAERAVLVLLSQS